MTTGPQHTIHASEHHLGWDNSLSPVRRLRPGESAELEILDASGGQIRPDTTVEGLAGLDFSRVNPVTGPLFVEGAEPGDALRITALDIAPSGWGWTANIPGFGLLADDFPEAALHLWSYDAQALTPAMYQPGGRVPLRPFMGTIGVAPAEPGTHSVVPPRRVGGNMDIRDLGVGSVLELPVEVPGALLSVGDTHAAQGDGEVCGTAIESPMRVALRVDLIKGAAIASPRYETPGPVSRHVDARGYLVTTGIGPDLMEGARAAVRAMIDLLGSRHGLAAVDAYMLLSVCADLRILEIVDQPHWVVGLAFPRVVLE